MSLPDELLNQLVRRLQPTLLVGLAQHCQGLGHRARGAARVQVVEPPPVVYKLQQLHIAAGEAVERSAATSATWSPGLSIARRQFSSCLTSSVPSTMDSLSMRYGTSAASSACSSASRFVRLGRRRQMSR